MGIFRVRLNVTTAAAKARRGCGLRARKMRLVLVAGVLHRIRRRVNVCTQPEHVGGQDLRCAWPCGRSLGFRSLETQYERVSLGSNASFCLSSDYIAAPSSISKRPRPVLLRRDDLCWPSFHRRYAAICSSVALAGRHGGDSPRSDNFTNRRKFRSSSSLRIADDGADLGISSTKTLVGEPRSVLRENGVALHRTVCRSAVKQTRSRLEISRRSADPQVLVGFGTRVGFLRQMGSRKRIETSVWQGLYTRLGC